MRESEIAKPKRTHGMTDTMNDSVIRAVKLTKVFHGFWGWGG